MYISVDSLFWFIIILLAIGALGLLIICLLKLFKVLIKVDGLLETNTKNLNVILGNIKDISSNTKDISDVVTDVTADAIIAKENITNKINNIKDIAQIAIDVFSNNT
ncbi:hypothetical protein K5V21_03515 [Clostridium sardiniense]|uniref:DUF948 domain-containing protein n=1 Tax=Clostridium sardiniense TaxID=29369 RepID=A0ABS7KUV8_CLOSR|nr:hypothetical protein [Clostridium sardiniense]MBY0754519.1 hypothetical protein [Clostridium sardiniense]MDQ0460886.1 uncharacterized protein YoxC [Clostridium sardiniense]